MGCRLGNLETGYKEGLKIYDIGRTVLNLFGSDPESNSIGKSLTNHKEEGFFERLKARLAKH